MITFINTLMVAISSKDFVPSRKKFWYYSTPNKSRTSKHKNFKLF